MWKTYSTFQNLVNPIIYVKNFWKLSGEYLSKPFHDCFRTFCRSYPMSHSLKTNHWPKPIKTLPKSSLKEQIIIILQKLYQKSCNYKGVRKKWLRLLYTCRFLFILLMKTSGLVKFTYLFYGFSPGALPRPPI